ncbi:MAG: PilZ domain-containing protein [Xanthomonadaceae bacterium]|nr:PilZ domain-containing protein [Xanthomonadaceae bacterium]
MSQLDRSTREQRRARRKPVNFAAVVTDAITEQPFGQLGNLSATGMLLISPAAPNSEAIYQLRLPLPGSDGAQPQYIEAGVQEQWHEHAASAGKVWAGYRIIAIGEDDARRLEAWLATPT